MLSTTQLIDIEAACGSQPSEVIRSFVDFIRVAAPALSGDLAEHAQALLLKLDHLAQPDLVSHAGVPQSDYLAPTLTVPYTPPAAA